MSKVISEKPKLSPDWEAFNVTISRDDMFADESSRIRLDYKGIFLFTIKWKDESLDSLYIKQGKDIYRAIQTKTLPTYIVEEAIKIDQNNWGNSELRNESSKLFTDNYPTVVGKVNLPSIFATDTTRWPDV